MNINKSDVLNLLRKLRFQSNYIGYEYLVECILLSNDSYFATGRIILKNIYQQIADKHNINPRNIESGIRTIVNQHWERYEDKIWRTVMSYELFDKPTVKELIEMINDYLV